MYILKKQMLCFAAFLLICNLIPAAASDMDDMVTIYHQKFSEINIASPSTEWAISPTYSSGGDKSFAVADGRLIAKSSTNGGSYEKKLTLTNSQLNGAFRVEFKTSFIENQNGGWGSPIVIGFPKTAYVGEASARTQRLDLNFKAKSVSFYCDRYSQSGTLAELTWGSYTPPIEIPVAERIDGIYDYKDVWIRMDVTDELDSERIKIFIKLNENDPWSMIDYNTSGGADAKKLTVPDDNNKLIFKVQGEAGLSDVTIYKRAADIDYTVGANFSNELDKLYLTMPIPVDINNFSLNSIAMTDINGNEVNFTSIDYNGKNTELCLDISTRLNFKTDYIIYVDRNAIAPDYNFGNERYSEIHLTTREKGADDWGVILDDEFINSANWSGGTVSGGALSLATSAITTLQTYKPNYNYTVEFKAKWDSHTLSYGGPVVLIFPKYDTEAGSNKIVFRENIVQAYYYKNGTTLEITTFGSYPSGKSFPVSEYCYIKVVVEKNDPTVYFRQSEAEPWGLISETAIGTGLRAGIGNLKFETQGTCTLDRFILKSPISTQITGAELEKNIIKSDEPIGLKFTDVINYDQLNESKVILTSLDSGEEISYTGILNDGVYEMKSNEKLAFLSDYKVTIDDTVIDLLGRSLLGTGDLIIKVDSDVSVSDLKFNASALPASDLFISCNLKNKLSTTVSLQLVVIKYIGNSMTDIILENIQLNCLENRAFTSNIASQGCDKIKAFFWLNNEELIPLSKFLEIK